MPDFRGRFRVYEEFLQPGKSDIILSIGCKGGFFERNLVDKVGRIYGIDIDKNEIEKNREKCPWVCFSHGDITKGLGFPDNHFNKVLFTEVIEHLPKGTEVSVLKEINRVLKKGGVLVFSTPNDNPVSKASDPAWWINGHKHYRIEDITTFLVESGFRIENKFVGGGYLQSLVMPFFYLLCGLNLYNEGTLERLVGHEYENNGFWTIIIKARKS